MSECDPPAGCSPAAAVTSESQQVVPQTSHVVHDLRPFTNYSVYVRAYSQDMASDPSSTIEFRTEEDGGWPDRRTDGPRS